MHKHTNYAMEIGNEVVLALKVKTYLSILPTVSTISIRRLVKRICTHPSSERSSLLFNLSSVYFCPTQVLQIITGIFQNFQPK